MPETTNLKITGMSCNHCVMKATKALEAIDGVDSVEVSLEPGAATVAGSADAEKLISAVKEAGYQAELA
jgi:copper chaperone CopZ